MILKSFWMLPALLRITIASRHSFNVNDDILAFPQYEVLFSNNYVSESYAQSRVLTNGNEREYAHDQHVDEETPARESDLPPPIDTKDEVTRDFEYQIMALDSRHYLCQIPLVDESSSHDGNNTYSPVDEENELARAGDRGWDLLKGMQGNCIYYWGGWWSYRFCYGQGVKQFHQLPPSQGVPTFPPIEDPNVTGFMLGEVQDDSKKELSKTSGEEGQRLNELAATKAVEVRGDTPYLVQRMSGGAMCDLTGKPRRIEVQFHCNPASQDRISLIKEIATCAYLMVIQTPRLCNDVAFLPPQKDHPNPIACSPILSEAELAAPDVGGAESAPHEVASRLTPEQSDSASAAPTPLSIGGMVIGAHNHVPFGVEIEKSAIVGGGKETYIDTIADSMGKLLSPDQLVKMGFGDPKHVEKLRKELERIAGNKGWKLDVFETADGKQYRAIIDDDDDDKAEGVAEAQGAEKQEAEAKDKQDWDSEEGSEETYWQKNEL